MTEFSYFTACTIDGYIADADNSLQWLFDVPEAESDSLVDVRRVGQRVDLRYRVRRQE